MGFRLLILVPALFASASPAAAAEIRSTMRVAAEVVPSCTAATAGATTTCSHQISFQAITATRPDERPLDEASRILGLPGRDAAGVRFAAPVRAAASEAVDPGEASDGISYLTISY